MEMDPIPVEMMEAPVQHHQATVVVAGARESKKKRSLDEVVPPAFVSEEDGAYGVVEMPKRFVVGNQKQQQRLHLHDKYRSKMAAFHAMDARLTALEESTLRAAAALNQRLRAQDAARAAAAGRQAAGDNS